MGVPEPACQKRRACDGPLHGGKPQGRTTRSRGKETSRRSERVARFREGASAKAAGTDARADGPVKVEQSIDICRSGDDEGARDVVNARTGDREHGDAPPREAGDGYRRCAGR